MTKHSGESSTVNLVSIYRPDAAQMDVFCERQLSEIERLAGQIDGALRVSLYRARNSKSVVKIASFESLEKYYSWRDSALFEEHLDRVVDIQGTGKSGLFDLVYDSDWR